jgi:D-alanyl-D-alanine carboxypeptidase
MVKRKYIIITATIFIFALVSYLVIVTVTRADGDSSNVEAATGKTPDASDLIPSDDNSDAYTYIPPNSEYDSEDLEKIDSSASNFVPATKVDLDPESITLLVNKEYSLSKDYIPSDLVIPNVLFNIQGFDERKQMRKEAAGALEKLFAAAQADGYTLYGVSGYRSYERQYQIFTENIVKQGKDHTLKYSAVPGTSEHQTGLSIDVSCKSLNFNLEDNFIDTPEGKWLSKNAHYYGFIIRYPKDKVDITGYAYEPWHIRYVGVDLAAYLYVNNLTLDEYYHYTPSPDFDFEARYADIINYTPPTPTPTPTPTVTPTPLPTLTPTLAPTPTVKPVPTQSLPPEDGNVPPTGDDGSNSGDPSDGGSGTLPGDGTSDGSNSGGSSQDGQPSDSGNTDGTISDSLNNTTDNSIHTFGGK